MSFLSLRRCILCAALVAASVFCPRADMARAHGSGQVAGLAAPSLRNGGASPLVAAPSESFKAATAQNEGPMFGSLSLEKLGGEKVSIEKLRGRLVLLNFWATWCKPCVGEMPLLAALARRYHDRGLVVVAASVDDPSDADAVARFAGHLPQGMEIWVGATPEDMARLKMGAALPATVLIDRDGRVLGARQGAITDGLLADDIEQALGQGGAEPKPPHKPLSGVTEASAGMLAPPAL